jgi:poly(hydroxyalkanoate) granule-associated protein
MVKKTKPADDHKADAKGDNQLGAAVRESAQQIWLAGLGAFAKAQQEGGKVFEALVAEGRGIHKRTRTMTEEKLGEVSGRVGTIAGGLGRQASESWDRLEQVFEERVARALHRLGVPTHAEVKALIERVDALNASVQALGGKAARTAAPRKAAARAAKAKAPAAPAAAEPAKAPRKAAAPRKTAAAAKAAPARRTAGSRKAAAQTGQ